MNKNKEDSIRAVLGSLRSRRTARTLIKAIPYVGAAIDEAIFGGDIEKALLEIREQGEERADEILANLQRLLPDHQYILVVGGGNAEEVLAPAEEFRMGSKHTVDTFKLYGGSGVNYSLRLLACGHPVYPILTIGTDELGEAIRRHIAAAAGIYRPPITEFLASDEFLVPGIATANATVVAHGNQRTIFSHKRHHTSGSFHRHMLNRLAHLKALEQNRPGAVLIGHIRGEFDGDVESSECGTTKHLIDEFSGKCPIFLNFGSSQLAHGYEFWKPWLRKATLVQFNLSEAKTFFVRTLGDLSLQSIMAFLSREGINAVITIDRFGAVGSGAGQDGLLLAWPLIERFNIKDPTGAGDAFMSGLVASLCGRLEFGYLEFLGAMDQGRRWAAYACTTLGGSSTCPDADRLAQYFAESSEARFPPELYRSGQAEHVLKLIDMGHR